MKHTKFNSNSFVFQIRYSHKIILIYYLIFLFRWSISIIIRYK